MTKYMLSGPRINTNRSSHEALHCEEIQTTICAALEIAVLGFCVFSRKSHNNQNMTFYVRTDNFERNRVLRRYVSYYLI